jgi:DNA-binding transcriptional MerR regulator
LKQHLYTTGQLAEKAFVTIRTLRYYDKVGLLKPSHHSDGGHRLYTNEDLLRLEQILGLKFLGFSLTEIKRFLETPKSLTESLSMQKEIMKDKKERIEQAIDAIEEVERVLQDDQPDWESVLNRLRMIRFERDEEWWEKYYDTSSQIAQGPKGQGWMEQTYTEEQWKRLQELHPGYTEEQARADSLKWKELIIRLKCLVAEGQDPADPEAQDLARRWWELIQAFTKGDEGILQSLSQGIKDSPYPRPYTEEEEAFINRALEIYKQNQ